MGPFEHGFINDDFHALGLDALHDALDAAGAVVVGAGFHDQAVDADDFGLASHGNGVRAQISSHIGI